MTVWSSRGHRGDVLEHLILHSNEIIRKKKLGRVDKVSIPIKVIEIDEKAMITKAFFEKKSTVDFIGVIQGVPIAFDVKETNMKNMPVKNIHEHQVEFMRDFTEQKGYAFMIVHFKKIDEYYLVPFEIVEHYFYNSKLRNIPYTCLSKEYMIKKSGNGILNYLTPLKHYINCRSSEDGQKI